MALQVRQCPGCGLETPVSERGYDRKFNASAECWSLFEEVLAAEFQNPVLFGQIHQLTVDTYAVQHAGGQHPDKSVCLHLVGLYLMLERDISPVKVPPLLQRLSNRAIWPHLDPPEKRASLTVHNVALADSPPTHAQRVREWAAQVWRAWSQHHNVIREVTKDLFGTTRVLGSEGERSVQQGAAAERRR